MYMTSNIGPRRLPWGTPLKIFFQSEHIAETAISAWGCHIDPRPQVDGRPVWQSQTDMSANATIWKEIWKLPCFDIFMIRLAKIQGFKSLDSHASGHLDDYLPCKAHNIFNSPDSATDSLIMSHLIRLAKTLSIRSAKANSDIGVRFRVSSGIPIHICLFSLNYTLVYYTGYLLLRP